MFFLGLEMDDGVFLEAFKNAVQGRRILLTGQIPDQFVEDIHQPPVLDVDFRDAGLEPVVPGEYFQHVVSHFSLLRGNVVEQRIEERRNADNT
jgi:hypothetical protein